MIFRDEKTPTFEADLAAMHQAITSLAAAVDELPPAMRGASLVRTATRALVVNFNKFIERLGDRE
jgi:hypothetical protein